MRTTAQAPRLPLPKTAQASRLPLRRAAQALLAIGVTAGLGACGSVRTELPTTVVPPPPLQAVAAQPTVAGGGGLGFDSGDSVQAAGPATTASEYKSPGQKHPLPGGTLAASYPRVGVRPPKGVAPPPPGQVWAVVNARFCAAEDSPIGGALVDPGRFRIEVPGQGDVAPATGAPALAKAPLTPGAPEIAAGTCMEGSLAFLVGGEGHVESVSYDTGSGLLRWAT